MPQFREKWEKPRDPDLRLRLKESITRQEPLKDRVEQAARQINAQASKLDSTLARLKQRDSNLFSKATSALQRHDTQTASALSSEIGEVRKMAKMVSQVKIVLEQINLRLATVHDLGDLAYTLAPAVGIMRSIRSGLAGVMPDAEHEISEVSTILGNLLVDAGQIGGFTLNFEAANEDAEKILAEASVIAEQRMKERFPDLPIPVGIDRSQQAGQT